MAKSKGSKASQWIVIVAGLLLAQAWPLSAVAGRATAGEPRIGRAVRHGTSPRPLREIRIEPGAASKSGSRHVLAPPSVPRPGTGSRTKGAVAQSNPGPSAPDMLLQFDGAATNDNIPFSGLEVIPPDANGAAGPNHYFQAINLVFRIFDKAGNLVLGPLPNASLWEGLGGICSTSSPTTPFVKYDTLAGRWFLSQAAFDPDDGSTHQCIAVSTTGDPTGTYAQYDFVIDLAGAPPHPIGTNSRFGIWPEAYYMTVNQFGDSGPAGFGIYAFDRAAILSGAPASFEYVNPGEAHPATAWGVPSDLDGSSPPPAGSPNFSVALGASFLDGSPADVLHVWKFHADFINPGNATFDGPVEVSIDPFDALPCGNPNLGEGCVPQLGSSQLIQASPSILMYRLAYRNFGDHESLVTNFTVDGSADGANRAAVRWLELRDPNGSPLVYQEGTYAPDDSYRFIGSIAMDRAGDMALGYSRSDATIHPSLAVTGRLVGDPLGTMGSENTFFEGPDSLPPVVGFWGNYSSMALDPSDDCTFWFTAEYIGDPAPFFEYSRIGSFKFASCTGGPSGVLAGTVTEAGSGNPVAGARVTAGASETLTDASGHYQFLTLPVGAYDMTVTKFGLVAGAASGIVVTDGGTTTQDFVLDVAPQLLLNGVVRDGSGADWPLYARLQVTAPGFAGATLYTDPVTGYYGITLVSGISYTIEVDAVTPGYGSVLQTVPLGAVAATAGTIVRSFALTIDPTACSAPGYRVVSDGLSEHFDSGELPGGWTVVNNGFGPWTIHTGPDCGFFSGNNTGGSGPFALVDSACDGEASDDTELITPSVDLSGDASAQVRFAQDFPGAGEIADVDVSTNGGLDWTNVFHQATPAHGPNTQAVDITAIAAGQADVRARFHYFNAFNSAWWQVDDVVLGQASCAPASGGLLVGNVFDANTGAGLNGATVQNVTPGGAPATSFATPEDPSQPDGLYILFSESASQSIVASLDPYAPLTQSTVVIPNGARRLDFQMTAGRLDAAPRPLSARVDPGGIVALTLDMSNTGTTDATFQIDELNVAPLAAPLAHGPFADPTRRASLLARVSAPALRDAASTKGIPTLPGRPSARPLAAGNVLNAYSTGLAHGWGVAFNTDAGDFWLSNPVIMGGNDRDYRYLTDGTLTGDTIDDSGWVAEFAADGAYNPRTGKLWRVNVGGDDCIYELDPVARAATGNRICPDFGTSERGLAYNPADDTYFAGSWNDGIIQHFDASGTILDSAYVAVPISGLAFNSSNGRLYAMTNHDLLQGFDVYVFDTRNHYAVVGGFFITAGGTPILGAMAGAGMEIDCNGHLWLVDQVSQSIFEAETGETGVCAFDEIPWLSEDPTEAAVSSGATLPVTCTFDSTGLGPGLRQAQLMFHTDTPYVVSPVAVDFTVRFLDVADASIFQAFVYGAAGAGVMPGCDPAGFLFCPVAQVTRADMAGFILRAVHGAGFVPTPYAGAFHDVQAGDYNADYIQSFFEEGYTVGCGAGNFCPDAVHTRGQTAVFILKGVHGTGYQPPPCASTHEFDDVPCPPTGGAPFGDWIGQLFTEGITAGCGGNDFCPGAGIPNEQMATFLVKAFAIPHL
jgi:hypothetical protein